MASWKKYFKSANTTGQLSPMGSVASQTASPGYKNYANNLPEVYIGHPNRTERYSQYDAMDLDPEVNAALDIIADFCTQINPENGTGFKLFFKENPTDTEVKLINEQLQQWCSLNQFNKRLFKMFRNAIKYGDQVFLRDPENFKLYWMEMHKVTKIIVNEGEGKVPEQYVIKDLNINFQNLTVTAVSTSNTYINSPQIGGPVGSYTQPSSPYEGGSRFNHSQNEGVINAEHVVHLTLGEGLDVNWPMGNSVLENIFKVFKQKELIEDAVLIYRIQRAPERRVFTIDVGGMPTHMAMAYVERIKNEIHQRRIPSKSGGQGGSQNTMDATYSPISTNEDYFFPVSAEGRGSKVDVLPGGCLAMDTKVSLLDGSEKTITELTTEYENGIENWTYSANPETGEVVPGLISWAGVTHESAKVVKLTLDNNKTIVCTYDHKFPIIGKGLVRADELVIGESFIPCNIRNEYISENKKREYTQVYQNNTKIWEFVHRMVAKNVDIDELIFDDRYKDTKKDVIHHVDHDRYNNYPTNLVRMAYKDHGAYHAFNGFAPEAQKLGTLAAKAYFDELKKDPLAWEEYTSRVSARSAAMWEKMSDTERAEHIAKQKIGIRRHFDNLTNEQYDALVAKNTKRGIKGSALMQDKLNNNPEFKADWIAKKNKGWDEFSKTPEYIARSKKLSEYMLARNKDPMLRAKYHANNKIKYDKHILNEVQSFVLLNTTATITETVNWFNNNELLLTYYLDLNKDTKVGQWRNDCISCSQLSTLVKHFGYTNWKHFKQEVELFNHKLIAIEYLDDEIQVGTLTIDVDEKYHSYHNFSLSVGIFTQNSNLGEVGDLRYFTNKMFRGLRIPSSYLPTGDDDSSATFNDGRATTALIQEWRFNQYCKRLQTLIVEKLDTEFKMFMRFRGINVDSSLFDLQFTEPQNFSKYRQIELDAGRIQAFTQLEAYPYISKRFAMQRFLGLTESELQENDELWAEENGKNGALDTKPADLRSVNVSQGGIVSDMEEIPDETAPDEAMPDEMGAADTAGTAPANVPPNF